MAGISRKRRVAAGMAPIFDDVALPERQRPQSAWLLTNRNNLIEVLASGLVKPAHLAPRHYTDLASMCPGYLPLLLHDPAPEWCQLVSSDGDYNYPVLLQIQLDGLVGHGYLIQDEQRGEFDGPLSGQTADVILVRAVLPLQRVTQIVFADDSHRTHVLGNRYDNVPDALLRSSRVDAHLFTGEPRDALVPALQEFQFDGQVLADEQRWYTRVDKIAGGLALAATSLSQHPTLSFAAIVYALNLLAGHSAADEKQISLVVAHLVGHAQPDTVRRWPNLPLLISAAELVADCTTGFSPLELVREAYRRAIQLLGEPGVLREQLQSSVSVLHDEQDLADFERAWPGRANAVPNALLRFALRRDTPPSHSQQESGEAEVIGWFLTGLLQGRGRVPVEIYPEAGLLRALDATVALFINRLMEGLITSHALQFQLAHRFGEETILQDGIEIACFAHQGLFEEAVDYFRGMAKDRMNEEAAVEFCRIMGWTNCVRAEVAGLISDQKDDLEMSVSGRVERKIAISFTGFAHKVQHHIRYAEFRRNLGLASIQPPPREALGALDTLVRGLRGPDKEQDRMR
jgi:hypothetical protein